MKKLLLVFMILMPASLLAELKFDLKTGIFSSTNAKKDVDQIEYHYLAVEIANKVHPFGIFRIPADRLIGIYGWLRAVNTPAALRLLEDLEKMIDTAVSDLRKLKNLTCK